MVCTKKTSIQNKTSPSHNTVTSLVALLQPRGRHLLTPVGVCHTEIQVTDQTCYLTQSQYTDTGPSNPSTDPITPSVWQAGQQSTNLESLVRLDREKRGSIPASLPLEVDWAP